MTDSPRAAQAARAAVLPSLIQGGMGVGVSSWQLARATGAAGGLGVVSGVALDLTLARRLQDGDLDGDRRRALAAFPIPGLADEVLARYFRPEGREEGQPYRPIPRLDMGQKRDAVRLAVLGAFSEVWLAKEGHGRPVGINLLEKVQPWTPGTLLGAMIADVDAVLMGAGMPTYIPRMLDALARGEAASMPVDIAGATEAMRIGVDPTEVLGDGVPSLRRPAFLAIVASHVLAAYLCREDVTTPDGFVIEDPVAGGHNAPPRRKEIDASGEPVYGERDVVDTNKVAALGLPFWLAGGKATPLGYLEARALGAQGLQAGSAFALCRESGMRTDLRERLLRNLRAGELVVRTDALASPTGFPFKVAQIEGTIADPTVERTRHCDLGYLRTPFAKDNGRVGYRCPAEPIDAYVAKGGALSETEGRKCLCNGLAGTVAMGQVTAAGPVEPPLLTLGSDLAPLHELLAAFPEGWSSADVVGWLTGATPSSPAAPVAGQDDAAGGHSGADIRVGVPVGEPAFAGAFPRG